MIKSRNRGPQKHKLRPIRIEGDIAFIQLSKGMEATVDAADLPLVEMYSWHMDNGYAKTQVRQPDGKQKKLMMHRVIAGTPDGMETDHINGNRVDNRRANLRNATPAQNQYNKGLQRNNKSGYKGVSFDKKAGKWSARIKFNMKKFHIGFYDTPESASAAYRNAALRMHGEFSIGCLPAN
jgi:hypothetical protein